MTYDLVVRGDAFDVGVSEGLVAEVGPGLPAGREEVDARGMLVLPGVVDIHVHLNDPGRDHWEGVPTGTRALAAGGVTCAADMPLNSSPPTVDARGLAAKHDALRGRTHVDVALWGGLVPGDPGRLEQLAAGGVVGFKAFMCPSGVDDFPHADARTLRHGMARAGVLGLPVAVHAEDPAVTEPLAGRAIAEGRTGMRDYLASRPARAELEAIAMALQIAGETGCSVHVVHVSTARGVRMVAEARERGVDATCETCPHYLVLDEDDAEAIGALAKCAPPLRPAEEVAALWAELRAGAVDLIASDHSPGPPEMKRGDDMFAVWGGIAGAQTTLALMLTHGPRHGLDADRLAALLAAAPARRVRLSGKGGLTPGADADIAIVSTGGHWTLREEDLINRHPHSPFAGMPLTARVERTILRGATVAIGGRAVGAPAGRIVTPALPVAA